ncbi:lanthionine synthetase LanC family protein [Granulicoccus phenolivorans]|uniref:lanthionine synthetase LanC family protein n=1 Tax=Granulicoccus phenolivorans TaxID=266854 RepID=UPI0003FF172F|nr:lanthionine synthetase LanC family protein [Granulicoccus phenolivorans]
MTSNTQAEPEAFQENTDQDYLSAVLEIVSYLRHNEVVTPEGKYWKVSPEPGNEYEGDLLINRKGLYAGSSGIGQFFLQLHDVTGEDQYLQEAKDAAEYILNTYEGVDFFTKVLEGDAGGIWPLPGWGTSVYVGPAGEAIFLDQLYDKVPDERYRAFLTRAADDAIAAGTEDEKGLHWTEQSDLMADGSYVFFFLYVYRRTGEQKYLDAALKVLAFAETKAVRSPVGGVYYKNLDLTLAGFDSSDTVFPNFTHGAAGTAYLNALVYEVTGEQQYLDRAKEVVKFLSAIAQGDEDGKLIPYLYNPDTGSFTDFFYLSTCHGPVGTTVLFRKLYELTGDDEYRTWVDQLSQGILRTGAPLVHSPGYWNSFCLCCGAPGVLSHFVQAGEFLEQDNYLGEAKITADKLLGDSYHDETGRRWFAAWTRKNPGFVETYTGLYLGAAGAGTSLLYLYAHDRGITITPTLEYLFLK